jgi:ribulose-bisphosphate carboxylase large chain
LQIQAGGGVSGHPKGLISGARAMNQAVDAYLAGKPLREYAKDHPELRLALDKWGE